jgi:antitoxin component of RelBE/YafQ-DinJ toxin-antitoxin module
MSDRTVIQIRCTDKEKKKWKAKAKKIGVSLSRLIRLGLNNL